MYSHVRLVSEILVVRKFGGLVPKMLIKFGGSEKDHQTTKFNCFPAIWYTVKTARLFA